MKDGYAFRREVGIVFWILILVLAAVSVGFIMRRFGGGNIADKSSSRDRNALEILAARRTRGAKIE
ncbi:MAG: hypothetical protein EA346_13765 [Thioalkalivibrio sp.]|nr:MAG: hypothetical protein EA346_13765 [Thioalkalivibrio sp.]